MVVSNLDRLKTLRFTLLGRGYIKYCLDFIHTVFDTSKCEGVKWKSVKNYEKLR